MDKKYKFFLYKIRPIKQNIRCNTLQKINEILKLYFLFKILKIKFKSL